MQFYKIVMNLNKVDNKNEENRIQYKSRSAIDYDEAFELSKDCERYSDKMSGNGCFFLSYTRHTDVYFGLIIRNNFDVDKYVSGFFKKTNYDVKTYAIKEIVFSEFLKLLEDADRSEFIRGKDYVLYDFEIEELGYRGFRRADFYYDETIIKEREKETIYDMAQEYFTKETFIPELDRIFLTTSRKKVYGHPVDYMIESDDLRTRKGITYLLVQALYNAKRIENRRYCEIELKSDTSFSKKVMEALYRTCSSGSIVLSFHDDEIMDEDIAHAEYNYIPELCRIINRHCCDVLTIICLPRECKNLKRKIFENTSNRTFIEIKEELASDEKAINYLRDKAKDNRVRVDKQLLCKVEKGYGYLTPELNSIFDEWYGNKLKTTFFKQYKDFTNVKAEIKDEKPKGKAYEELDSMIGLKSAKEVISQALDSYKAKKLFKDMGMKDESGCNHMIFTGNPGTAKTTAARLFARILKENDVLSKGHIVEVGRGDLVGKFVGWTAPTIKNIFKKAIGGILFIDEAYSLVDDRDGSFGDEAINTIVQEMENHREEVIVIFAGYPDKMEIFLDKNPGLRSRIAHYVHFEDYNADELCQIAKHIAKEKGLVLEDDAVLKMNGIMEEARKQADFGNGRFARNIIEKARTAQQSRLIHIMNSKEITPQDVKTICAEDIKNPVLSKTKTKYRIGFSV